METLDSTTRIRLPLLVLYLSLTPSSTVFRSVETSVCDSIADGSIGGGGFNNINWYVTTISGLVFFFFDHICRRVLCGLERGRDRSILLSSVTKTPSSRTLTLVMTRRCDNITSS